MPKKDVNEVDLEQQNVGPGGQEGGGEWPHPATPPQDPAPGDDLDRLRDDSTTPRSEI